MDLYLFIKGFIIGFTIAASIGPIGILCIRRSIANGYLSGFASGMGVATADGFFGAVAAFSITFISSFLVKQQVLLQIIGIAYLVYLGIKIFSEKPKETHGSRVQSKGLLNDYLSILFLTLINPMTILLYTAVFAGLTVAQGAQSYGSASLLTLGVFLGSAVLYLLLSIVFGVFGKNLKPTSMIWVNRVSGSMIISFAVVTVVSLVKNYVS